ncbi:MAG: hypothetical protein JNK82_36605 [Myxococcaceae bacterium]|nr:hypothetical protein [Myxococcaceae bacterium]
MQRSDQGDELVPKRPSDSEFEKSYAPGTAPHTPLKLGAKEYDGDLWDSPVLRTLKRAVVGWDMPSSPASPGRVLKDDDVRLAATAGLPGRDAWRKALQQLVVSAGAVESKPTLFGFLGPSRALVERLVGARAFPAAVARVEPEFLASLVPEHSVLETLGDERAALVVRAEVEAIAAAAFTQALGEKRDVLVAPVTAAQLQLARQAGYRRIVLAVGERPADAVANECDEWVQLAQKGTRLDVVAQKKGR